MTLRDFTTVFKDTKKGKNAHRAHAKVYFGQIGKNLNPLHIEGWADGGRVITLPPLSKNIDKEKIVAGMPGGLLLNIPKEITQDMTFVFDTFKLATLELSNASDIPLKLSYADNGQTTIASSPTIKSATLTSAEDINVNDAVIVDCRHATYGGFPDMTVITKVDKDTDEVEFEPLNAIPATGATFKKLAGKTSGTNADDTGVNIPGAQMLEFPRCQLLIAFHIVSSRAILLVHIKEFEINAQGLPDFSDFLGKCSIIGNPILQDPKAYTMADGTTEYRGYYDDTVWVPFESPADA